MNDPDPRHIYDGFDHDAIFADIVAHLDEEASEPVRRVMPWIEEAPTEDDSPESLTHDAAATDQPPAEDPSPIDQPPAPPTPAQPPVMPTPQVWVWRAYEVDEEHEEHFEPLPVAPLPVGDLQFWAILAGMGGGPLLLLYLVLFNRDASSYWIFTAIAMSVGGFALLVSRIPGHQGDDDDGARL
jgi:hypothetical protein